MRLPMYIIIKLTLTMTPFQISIFLLQDSTYVIVIYDHPITVQQDLL